MNSPTLNLIVSKIAELSLEEKSDDPVRNIHSIMIRVDNEIESIMCELRKQERYAKTHSEATQLD